MEHFAGFATYFLRFIVFYNCFLGSKRGASAFLITERNSYLANHAIKTVFTEDWLDCCLACQAEEQCISYNFNELSGKCDLNDQGLQEPFIGLEELVKSQGVVFHQIRPAPKLLTPRLVQSASQCDCSCASESACTPGPGPYDRLPVSCQQIWETTSIRKDGPFYIRAEKPAQFAHVFCHMTPIPGCGDGGWTLVMKIDGKKTTFGYKKSLWQNKSPYNKNGGTNIQGVETKLSSFWSTPFTRLCLGMKYENESTHWIAIGVNYTRSSLYDVISGGHHSATKLNVSIWKHLVDGSKLQEGCTIQGFNSQDVNEVTAKARIGIIGFPNVDCNGSSQSRIGFGTSGNWYGMKDANSCGNEYPDEVHKKTFGFIFVQ